jgi:serine/threonine protein kinase/tetratricopeptide (TPR) repeat protein
VQPPGNAERSAGQRCPGCARALISTVAGLCPACLMRLGLGETAPPDAPSVVPAPFTDWLRVKGARVGGYELLDELARGGMGIVYRARQLQPARVVALKMMLPYLATSAAMRNRFRIESDAVAGLDHPGILPVYEVGEHGGLPFFSMKFADGGSLAKRELSLAGQWRDIASILGKVASAVQHAHERGILHRDLKPGNVLFDGRGEPMVADFGLAKFRAVDQNLTLPASVLGSPHYMAPEQMAGKSVLLGPTADVYSLGAILYELLTGRPPIHGQDALSTMQLVRDSVPDSGISTNPEIPAALDAIALKCLEKEPSRRYPSAGAMAEDLQRWLQGKPVLAYRRGRRTGARPAILTAVMLAAFTGLVVSDSRQHYSPSALFSVGTPEKSIVVFPFKNLGPNTDDDYLADAVAAQLVDMLVELPGVKVVNQSLKSSTGYETESAQSVGARLGAAHIVRGDLRRTGSRLEVRAHMIRASDGSSLWSKTFDEDVEQEILLQERLRASVLETLRVSFPAVSGRAPNTPRSAEAHNLYLEGRYYARRFTANDLQAAIDRFERAVAIDPNDAATWAALSKVHIKQFSAGQVGHDEAGSAAREAALRALRLDPALARAHAALAIIYLIFDWNPVAADAEMSQALKLAPGDGSTIDSYGNVKCFLAQYQECLRLFQIAATLDPTSAGARGSVAYAYVAAGRFFEAIAAYREALAMNPDWPGIRFAVALALLATNDMRASRAELDRETDPDAKLYGEALIAWAEGRRAAADIALASFKAARGSIAPASVAAIHAYRNEADEASVWIQRAIQQRDIGLITELRDATYLVGRADYPRYRALVNKAIGLPGE